MISDKDGNEKMALYWSKEAKDYRLRKVYEQKDMSFKIEILQKIAGEALKPTPKVPGVSMIITLVNKKYIVPLCVHLINNNC